MLRNAYQSDTARFLTEHTPRQLNRAFRKIAAARGLSVPDTARLFAMIHAATADSSIACYEAKYHYNLWRPIQAIPGAEQDGNKRTTADPSSLPFITPAHPAYPSSHVCHTSAAMPALRKFFGTDRIPFTVDSTVTGTTHSFQQLPRVQRRSRRGPHLGRHPLPVLDRGGEETRREDHPLDDLQQVRQTPDADRLPRQPPSKSCSA
jgi:hypothetical protein